MFPSPLMGDACKDAGGTTPRMESVESSQDAYRDIGGRATQEAKAEQRPRATQDAYKDVGGRECQEHILEAKAEG